MKKFDLLLRFLLGGLAVMLSYLVSIIFPWQVLAGIFATFPAVMITAILMVGLISGSKSAAKTANGSIYGMVGGAICVITVWLCLSYTDHWLLSVMLGLFVWLISSVLIARLKERLQAYMEHRFETSSHKELEVYGDETIR